MTDAPQSAARPVNARREDECLPPGRDLLPPDLRPTHTEAVCPALLTAEEGQNG